MPITLLDGILIAITLFSGVLAMVRGFSREILSVASWVAAAAAGFYFHKQAAPLVQPYVSNELLAKAAAGGAIFLITLIIVTLITMKIADLIIDSSIGALDRTLGFLFGAARGVLLVVVAMLFFNWLAPANNQPGWIANAKSKPLIDSLGQQLVGLLPEDPEAAIEKIKSGVEGSQSGTEEEAPADADTQKPADGAAKPAAGGNG